MMVLSDIHAYRQLIELIKPFYSCICLYAVFSLVIIAILSKIYWRKLIAYDKANGVITIAILSCTIVLFFIIVFVHREIASTIYHAEGPYNESAIGYIGTLAFKMSMPYFVIIETVVLIIYVFRLIPFVKYQKSLKQQQKEQEAVHARKKGSYRG